MKVDVIWKIIWENKVNFDQYWNISWISFTMSLSEWTWFSYYINQWQKEYKEIVSVFINKENLKNFKNEVLTQEDFQKWTIIKVRWDLQVSSSIFQWDKAINSKNDIDVNNEEDIKQNIRIILTNVQEAVFVSKLSFRAEIDKIRDFWTKKEIKQEQNRSVDILKDEPISYEKLDLDENIFDI